MEDSELTRKAIEELMKEMDEHKEKESTPMERKKNPLGKPNKLFLGRTINSVMTHNKRQSDRSLQGCKRKLKELDAKLRKNEFRRHHRDRDNLESSHEVISSDSDEAYTIKSRKKLKRRKKKRKNKNKKQKQRSYSSSSSTSSSSTQTYSGGSSCSKKKKYKKMAKSEGYEQKPYNDYVNEITMGYYVDPNLAYAAMAYNHMSHMMQQQQIVRQQMVKEEENVEIPSDLSLSFHSSPESSFNISLNSSSAEEDENGILTFKLSSDDEENVSKISPKRSINMYNNNKSPLVSEEVDKDSVDSHISLDSKDSRKSVSKVTNEIYLLSSSSSDSDELEIVETIIENLTNFSKTDGTSIMKT